MTTLSRKLYLTCIGMSLLTLAGCSSAPVRAPIDDRSIARTPAPSASLPDATTSVEEPAVTITPYRESGGSTEAASPLSESEAPRALDANESPPPSTAVTALLDTAGQQARAGNLDTAAATLERALRLEPRNPELWTRLAEIRLQQGEFDQAANLAAKSNNLAGNNAALITRNLKIIEQARGRKGAVRKPG